MRICKGAGHGCGDGRRGPDSGKGYRTRNGLFLGEGERGSWGIVGGSLEEEGSWRRMLLRSRFRLCCYERLK